MMAGMISVPIYATAGTKTIDYVLKHSEVKALFVGKLDSTDAIQNIETKVTTVGFDYQGVIATDHKWSDWVNDHQPLAQVPEYQPADTLSIVYTSGSTGVPKGVIISHRNAVAVVAAVSEYLPEGEIRVLSYLPMAHITERAIVAMTSFYNDMQIFFNESLETFPADLQHAKVTVFISVPRLWTKFRAMVLAGMPDEQLQAVLKTEQDPTVAAQIRAKLGLAQCKFFGSGAAPISGALLRWYKTWECPSKKVGA
jgi:long-subunit acyl-CoA synthetase (AMP-forming)